MTGETIGGRDTDISFFSVFVFPNFRAVYVSQKNCNAAFFVDRGIVSFD